jgi:L-threonylcarbamoyladenylate synthase
MTAGEIVEQWSDAVGRGILRVLDGGRLRPSPPSTVVDCTGRRPRVIRPGAIPAATLRETVPDLIGDA